MTLKKIKHSLLLIAMVAVAWSCGGVSKSTSPKLSSVAAPTGAKVEMVNSNTIKVTWTAVDKATGYVIYYSTSSGVSRSSATKKDVASSATTGEVSDQLTDLTAGTYYVVVASKDAKGESSTTSSEVSVALTASTSGVPLHTGATWTKSERGPVAAMDFDNGVTGDDGTLLGSRSINKSKLTFKVTVDTTGFREIQWLLFVKAESGGAETNFQLMVVSANETRFILQRFGDFSDCSPRGLNGGRWGCEEQDHHGDVVFNDTSRVYNFDCNWDGTAGSKVATCLVTSSDGSIGTVTYQVGMGGGYNSLLRLAVGTFSIDGYPEVPSTVTDFRFSVM